MYKTLISLLAALFFVVSAHAQINFQFGPEVGAGVWGLASTDGFTNSYLSYESNQSAGASGIFGLSGRWMFGRHWQLQHGLNYQRTTIHQHGYYHDDYAGPYSTLYKYDNHQRLHMLAMPITVGFVVGKGKVRASFNVGARLGYIFAAINEVNREYADWPDFSPKPDPVHENVYFLKGQPRDRFMVQGLWSFQMEFAQKLSVGLNVALGPYRDNSPSIDYHPPKVLPFLSLTYRPFGKELKAAPVGDAAARSGNWLETGPEIGYSMPIGFAREWTQVTAYGNTNVRQSPKFTPMIGWAGRFGISRHLFVDAGLQYQFEGLHFETEIVYPGEPYDYMHHRTGTISVHKLCLPLALGYQMEFGKFKPFVAAGFRANYLSYRKEAYEQKSYLLEPGANPEPTLHVRKGIQYPFAERMRGQIMASAGTGVGQHLRFSLTYAIGNGYNDDQAIIPKKYINQDLYMTVGWRFVKGGGAGN